MSINNQQKISFNLKSKLQALHSSESMPEYGYSHDIAILQDDDFENIEWQLTSFNKSKMAEIPLFALLKPEDLIVFELSDPDTEFQSEGSWTIVISNDSSPSLFCTRTYLPDEGFDLNNYNLTAAQSLVESLPSRAIRTFKAFRFLILASTKLADDERELWLSRVDSELVTVNHYISNYLEKPCSSTRLTADVEIIVGHYINKFFDYWEVIDAHKVTDFNFITEK